MTSNGFNGFGTALVRLWYGFAMALVRRTNFIDTENTERVSVRTRNECLDHTVCRAKMLSPRKKNRNNGSKDQQSASAEPMMAPFLCFDCVDQGVPVQVKMLFHPSPPVCS